MKKSNRRPTTLSRFLTTDIPKKPPKKRFPFLYIFLAIFFCCLPLYFYLVLTGQMFEFDFVKRYLTQPEPIEEYRTVPKYTGNPNQVPKPIGKPKLPPAKISKSPPKKVNRPVQVFPLYPEPNEMIYSWVDSDGVKQFSNIKPVGIEGDIYVSKAMVSKRSKRFHTRPKFSFVNNSKKTAFQLINDQILVPVILEYDDKRIKTQLVLDTGATTTTIHNDFSRRFPIYDYKYSKARVADGRIVETKRTVFDSIIVGPHRMNNIPISIINYQHGSDVSKGLLGMNFLKNVRYQIDYQNRYILWQ